MSHSFDTEAIEGHIWAQKQTLWLIVLSVNAEEDIIVMYISSLAASTSIQWLSIF